MPKQYDQPLSVNELSALDDHEIDFSEIPELDETFWKNAKRTCFCTQERI